MTYKNRKFVKTEEIKTHVYGDFREAVDLIATLRNTQRGPWVRSLIEEAMARITAEERAALARAGIALDFDIDSTPDQQSLVKEALKLISQEELMAISATLTHDNDNKNTSVA